MCDVHKTFINQISSHQMLILLLARIQSLSESLINTFYDLLDWK